jgi:hypothetical protein
MMINQAYESRMEWHAQAYFYDLRHAIAIVPLK